MLEGKQREVENDFEYDIGDKVSGPISLPVSADVKLREKKRQFESLDYRAQRVSQLSGMLFFSHLIQVTSTVMSDFFFMF